MKLRRTVLNQQRKAARGKLILFQCVSAFLTSKHSAAEIEWVFSLLKLTKTPKRNRMKTEALEALILRKTIRRRGTPLTYITN